MSLPRYSSAILPFAAGTICRARVSNGLVNNDGQWRLPSGRGVQRKISRRVKPLAGWVATCALLFSPCVPVRAELLKGDVDFSNYDAPLSQQIVNRIKAKVAARLGEGVNTQDRYFIVPFAYQDKRNNPEFAHSFMSVIRVLGDGKQPSLTAGFRRGRFKNRDFEAFVQILLVRAYQVPKPCPNGSEDLQCCRLPSQWESMCPSPDRSLTAG